jgi:hypothetical protein
MSEPEPSRGVQEAIYTAARRSSDQVLTGWPVSSEMVVSRALVMLPL